MPLPTSGHHSVRVATHRCAPPAGAAPRRPTLGLLLGLSTAACGPDPAQAPVDVAVPEDGCRLVLGFADADGDGTGAGAGSTVCTTALAPLGLAITDGDCDDQRADVHPGAPELCDGHDNDCDRRVDDDDPDLVLDGPELQTAYPDADGDRVGDPDLPTPFCGTPPAGHVLAAWDCDDTNPEADRPALFWPDADGDGNGDATAPAEEWCGLPSGYVDNHDDCDDTDPEVHPAATERCNGIDDDCDGDIDLDDDSLVASDVLTVYPDDDGDGYGSPHASTVACTLPSGFALRGDDCDDRRPDVHPGAPEACGGTDYDCDGIDGTDDPDLDPSLVPAWYLDADGDGWGETTTGVRQCGRPAPDWTPDGGDCDETDRAIHPGATETCNDLDDDCDGLIDDDDPDLVASPTDLMVWPDADGDGYGVATGPWLFTCTVPSGHAAQAGDCDDTRASTRPSAEEVCDNGIDDDCDGTVDDCSTPTTHVLEWSGSAYAKPSRGEGDALLGFDTFDIGDVDGDTVADVLAGSDAEHSAYLSFGTASWATAWETPSTTILHHGAQVRIAGDLNGDGFDDLVSPYDLTGFVWVPGAATSLGTTTLADLLLAGDATHYTTHSTTLDVEELGAAGDLDHDGYDDLWMRVDQTHMGRDAVWIFPGSASMLSSSADYTDEAAVFFESGWTSGGRAIVEDTLSFGDIDGDGSGDAAWGHPHDPSDGTGVGQVYLWTDLMGRGATASGMPVAYDTKVGTSQPTVVEDLGEMVRVVGDIDTDGYDDVLISSQPASASAGSPAAAWLLYGSSSIGGHIEVEDAELHFEAATFAVDDHTSARGDATSDGIDDLILAVRGLDTTSGTLAYDGVAAIFVGGSRRSGTVDLATDADWTVFGQVSTLARPDRMLVGDVDESGLNDIIFASSEHRETYLRDGALFVLPDFAAE